MKSLSFDGLSAFYDQTRTVDPTCFAAALDWIAARFLLIHFGKLLEPGIGTGRVALLLSELTGDARVAQVLIALGGGGE